MPAVVYLRGFTIDDALIPARYAWNIARGFGYRFNTHGPITDGVTPLGFPYLLAPFAKHSVMDALYAARALGMLAWLGAAGGLGLGVSRVSGSRARYAALALIFLSAPLGAWASAGLETGVVMALATLAAVLPTRAAYATMTGALLGACAWLRPEMIAFAACLAIVRAHLAEKTRTRALILVLAMGPWCLAAAIRAFVWGRPAPLAVLAKPSDLAHGVDYVLRALFFTGIPLAALAPRALLAIPVWPRALVVASFIHLGVVAMAGGDWMPLARLFCPVLPPLVFAIAHLLATMSSAFWTWLRFALACAGEMTLVWLRGPTASHVLADRVAIIEASRPLLHTARRVATIDVGWVGAATESEIIDLAGATDPEIAALSGGHTSKAIPIALLFARNPEMLVLELDPRDPRSQDPVDLGARRDESSPSYARITETRLGSDPRVTNLFRTVGASSADLPIRYVFLSRQR